MCLLRRFFAVGLCVCFSPQGTSFPFAERDRLGIRGLVPPTYFPPRQQMERVMRSFRRLGSNLEKYSFLAALQDRNEVLFYRLLESHLPELAHIVYTPTIGEVCLRFGDVFRRPRGMYFSAMDRYEMSSMVYNWPHAQVDVVVVTDGSRILGLGDLGLNGIGIPVGKSALYVAGGGIHPARTMPCVIDVGTDNVGLRNDPLYLGIRQQRLKGADFVEIVDEFMRALNFRYPNVLVQFEDFSQENARMLLARYRDKYLCFNDDIQGTGASALAGVLCSLRKLNLPPTALKDQRVLVLGAGSAGLGVAGTLLSGMLHEGATPEQAYQAFYLVDHEGLLGATRTSANSAQKPYARSDLPDGLSLQETVERVKPTIMLGLSGVAGLFTESVVRAMTAGTPRPIIFPMSNPSSKTECTPQQALTWSQGRAIVATGSPFPATEIDGVTYHTSQANNMFIFPGVGLAAVAAKIKTISDRMFYQAACTLAQSVSADDLNLGKVYPDTNELRETSALVAAGVVKVALDEGVATAPDLLTTVEAKGDSTSVLLEFVKEKMWRPRYATLVPPATRS